MNTIVAAIARASGSPSVEAVGAALGAGTNCGSCRPRHRRGCSPNAKEAAHG